MNIDEDKIKDLVGIPKFVYVHSIIKGIIEKDIETSLKAMEDVLDEGKDLENFLWEMIKHTKDILIYKVSKKKEIYNEEELKQIEETAKKASKEEIINIIYKLSELENKMKSSSQKTIIFETGIIKLCAKIEPQIIEQNQKVEPQVEAIINRQQAPEPKQKLEIKEKDIGVTSHRPQDQEPIPKQTKPVTLSPGEKLSNWETAIDNLKKQGKVMLYANLIGTDAVEINDMTVEIRFYNGLNDFRKDLIQKNENMNALVKEISVILGKPMQIKLKDASGEKQSSTSNKKQAFEDNVGAISNHSQPTEHILEEPEAKSNSNTNSKNEFEDLGIEINYIDEE